MTQKVLLAESLDLLQKSEINEYEMDRMFSNKTRGDMSRVLRGYEAVYQQYIRGVHILNYVRHTALKDKEPRNAHYNKNLSDFCAGKMSAYMDRCENILRKLDNVFIPLEQVDQVTKEGYVPEDTIFIQDGTNYPLTRKEKSLAREIPLTDGTYILTFKNRDDYTLAAPDIALTVVITPQRGSGAEAMRVDRTLPCQFGWRKVIGVMEAATLQFEIRASGVRDAHVDVLLQKWKPGSAMGGTTNSEAFARTDSSGTFGGGGSNTESGTKRSLMASGKSTNDDLSPGGALRVENLPPLTMSDPVLSALANFNVPKTDLPAMGHGYPAGAASSSPQQQQQGFYGGGGGFDGYQQTSAYGGGDPYAGNLNALEQLQVPHGGRRMTNPTGVPPQIDVNPPGLTQRQRLDRLREMMNLWPDDNVMSARLPQQEQQILQAVMGLPYPRELS